MSKRLLVPFALLGLFYVLDAGTVGVRAQNYDAERPPQGNSLRYLASSDEQSTSSAKSTAANQDTQDSQQQIIPGQLPKIHIDAIEPEAGPTSGETRVLVRGGPFSDYKQLYPKPMCKFGHDDMIVEATYVLCTAAPQWVQEKEARHRDKNETCLQCDNSPASAKSEIVPFTVSLTGDFKDVTNSIPFRFYNPTKIFSIYPRYGPKDGETIVQVWGENFLNFDENTRCAFGTKSVEATFINSNYIICVAPFSDVVEKPIPFTISLNNQQNSKDTLFYWYYSQPAITELIPDRGPDTGGSQVLLKGRNFHPFRDNSMIANYNDTFCMFEDIGKVPAVIINSTKVQCLSPPSYVLRQAIVEITLNNQQYTDDNNIFYYYRPPFLFDANPRQGPISGGTRVIAIGSNFQETKNIKCKFNTTVVNGKFLSSSEIECIAPPSDHPGFVPFSIALELDLFSPALQYLYYEKPVIDHIEPVCGPDYGYTQITVRGSNFIDMGRDQVLCIFNKTIYTNATIMDSETIKCDSPSLLNAQGYSKMTDHMLWYDVEITVDGGRERAGPSQRFNYYRDPKILDISPNSGPLSGGTKVKVIGQGYNQQGACNKTLRFSVFETKPIAEVNDSLAIVTSPPATNPDAVVVSIALNGQQFIKDLTVHFKDPENTFEYYSEPVVTGFEPNAGPSVGGTQMIINGYGFTPRRDENGNPDKKRNKMWIRFVDHDVQTNELAPRYLVKAEDLSDDQAIWYTPALPSDTKALMQISLNNEDWHNVPLPKKTFSFTYYESPHVFKLNPAYGPVKHKGELFADIEGSNFVCPEPSCQDLLVRFGEPGTAIYQKGTWVSNSHIRVKIPKYSKPEVLRVEVTVNGKDWSNDGKNYGYFDPYVIRAEPTLVSVDGTTKIQIIGFGFVNSTTSKSMVRASSSFFNLVCQGKPCIKDAVFINQNVIESSIYPQSLINYKENDQNILWDAMYIDASIHGASVNDFTDNGVQIFFYEEPDYKELSVDESPANIQTQLYITTDFKKNPIDRLKKYANITCRFKNEDGQVAYSVGEMISYPLERGAPNAVTCRSTKWNLAGKPFENAKLDIALNGQDFRGNLDFIFSQEISIHRTVPMAGPVQGSSKTKIIGTGYKPARSDVQIKWGVLSSDTIPKSSVEDYIYSKYSFENMIEGSDELKSYIYEAASFPRVDSEMEEDKSYHAVYMKSAEIDTYTQTNGGPFYVEAGRNVEIKFKTKANVTLKLNNTNSTSVQTQVVEQNIIKTWIYYEFEPSSVEYYYYKDCIVKDINPHSGLILGGTKVAVSGAWFKYMPEYGVVPHCKFGNKIVRATFDSTVRIVCVAPPGEELGVLYPFEVSLNGVDFSDSGMKFSYYDVPALYGISPIIGPESGGTLIYINGKNFFNISNPQEFNCKFTPINMPIPPKKMPGIYVNSTSVLCASPGGWGQGVAVKLQVTFNGIDYDNSNFTFTFFSITRAFPRSGPSDGLGGDIIIEGNGFRNDSGALCKLNDTVYQPTSISWKQIRCPMPIAASGEDFFGNVDLSVSPNGNDWHNFLGGFQYYPQPIVDDIFPKQGPSMGVGIVSFYGSGFRNDYNLVDMACKIGDSIGKAVYISDKHIKCVVEDMPLVNEGEYLPAQLALNKYSWTTLGNSTFYLPYGVNQIYPNSGPITGVTDVIIQGQGFVDETGSASPRCRFGTPANFAIVEAQILSYERMVCKAPVDFKPSFPGTYPTDVPIAIALTNDENDPWTETSHKFRFYEQPPIVKCDPCEVDVGSIREVYVWAEENAQFFEPLPSVQRKGIDLEAQENGLISMASSLGGITCQFGRFGETQAIFVNSTVIKCITPVVEDEPDSIYREIVKLTVAMNGVDHEEQTSELEFTFIGTGSYLGFWPFLFGALLVGLLIVALIQFSGTLFNKISMDDAWQYVQGGRASRAAGQEGVSNVFNAGNGYMMPRGTAAGTGVGIQQRMSVMSPQQFTS